MCVYVCMCVRVCVGRRSTVHMDIYVTGYRRRVDMGTQFLTFHRNLGKPRNGFWSFHGALENQGTEHFIQNFDSF